MMSALSGTSLLDVLRRKFIAYPDGLSIEQFVEAMMDVLPLDEMGKTKVEATVDLIELFKDIDVNGDGTVEWSELLAFTIEVCFQHGPLPNVGSFTDRLLLRAGWRRRHKKRNSARLFQVYGHGVP